MPWHKVLRRLVHLLTSHFPRLANWLLSHLIMILKVHLVLYLWHRHRHVLLLLSDVLLHHLLLVLLLLLLIHHLHLIDLIHIIDLIHLLIHLVHFVLVHLHLLRVLLHWHVLMDPSVLSTVDSLLLFSLHWWFYFHSYRVQNPLNCFRNHFYWVFDVFWW